MSFSTSGFTALAFAWLVLMRSCSISSRERLRSSDFRCAESRLSFPLCLPWRISLLVSERESQGVQGVLHLVGRALAEVRDRVQLRLRALDQVADGLDAGALQAVVRPHADLELLDQPVVALGRGVGRELGLRRTSAVAAGELLDAIGVGEDRQALDQDLGRLAKRAGRLEGTVGLDLELELVEVRPLADAGGIHGVRRAADRREDRVDRDHAQGLVLGLVLLRRRVAAAAA